MEAEARLEETAAKAPEWLQAARFAEGRAELEELLEACPGPSVARARGLVAAGTLAFFQGDAEAARIALADADPEAARTWSERARGVGWAMSKESARRFTILPRGPA